MKSSFHAHHSPMGAHSSLTCGMHGARGGMAMEKGQPADGGVYVGYEDETGGLNFLPLFAMNEGERARYVQGGQPAGGQPRERVIPADKITRDYRWASDSFSAEGVSVEIVTPFFSIPDPAASSATEQKYASCPASLIKVSCDNRKSKIPRRFFFAIAMDGRWAVSSGQDEPFKCLTQRDRMGMATEEEVESFVNFDLPHAMRRRHRTPHFLLGGTAGFIAEAKAGEKRELLISVGYFKQGNATTGKNAKYWYTRYFSNLEEVLRYSLETAPCYLAEAEARDAELASAKLTEEQKFLIAHATHSYWGSTEWLDDGGRPRWVVNEGEYLMMNTFDLTVDMLFFEMRFNPWTVRNVLDQFVSEYRYYDQVFEPGKPGKLYEGGIAFTHDMGVMNQFSPSGRSSYEVAGLDRECFSFMTCEQLANWVCCAGVYFAQTRDADFLVRNRGILEDCLRSLQHRDHPDPRKRTGIMKCESSFTQGGGEITTYDSLDHSLGQARNNIYLASKCWASYLALEYMFQTLGAGDKADECVKAAKLCAKSLVKGFSKKLGFIPAVLEGDNQSAIIPVIEGLIFPHEMGLKEALSFKGPYGSLMKTLKRHLENVLVEGVCLYPDGGWKLSATADNSWMSKINLCQHIAGTILGVKQGKAGAVADHAHAEWERNGSEFEACSDQFKSGKAVGSKYYPRIVTNILWMK
ncbi:MAG: glycoside hydrolase family 52 protein [bacterium]